MPSLRIIIRQPEYSAPFASWIARTPFWFTTISWWIEVSRLKASTYSFTPLSLLLRRADPSGLSVFLQYAGLEHLGDHIDDRGTAYALCLHVPLAVAPEVVAYYLMERFKRDGIDFHPLDRRGRRAHPEFDLCSFKGR